MAPALTPFPDKSQIRREKETHGELYHGKYHLDG